MAITVDGKKKYLDVYEERNRSYKEKKVKQKTEM